MEERDLPTRRESSAEAQSTTSKAGAHIYILRDMHQDEASPSLLGDSRQEGNNNKGAMLPSLKLCLSDVLDNLIPENHPLTPPRAPEEGQECHYAGSNATENNSQSNRHTQKEGPERGFHGAEPEIEQRARGKKRKHMVAAHPQLAIEPKIASTTQPEENHIITPSQVLASKSNYECIIEGTGSKLGLAYPDQLLKELDAKRVSHKNAEKDRRDRLSRALQALSELIADYEPDASISNIIGEVVSLYKEQHGNKAATVEAAVQYIKSLRKELVSLREKLKGCCDCE